ncbi:uncharacterized protein LOC142340004 [Convolutriloba macropyga]|uniref:uncharacterized protein LOC142340004 n=1 Tax=Convolutriloba macropyga TaxID=536237 RepID=UPI003F51D88F
MAMSTRSMILLDLVLLSVTTTITVLATPTYPSNMCYVGGAVFSSIPDTCFYLLSNEPVSFEDALQICATKEGRPVSVQTKADLNRILQWAIEVGLPNDTEAGFWTIWKREIPAPLSEDGTLSPQNENLRKNRVTFVGAPSGASMPQALWRNETQPGNTVDRRDEQCTAQSRPGKQPEYLGLDDYECNGAQLHYAMCQSVLTEAWGED